MKERKLERKKFREKERKKDGYCCLVVNIVFEDI